MCWFYSGCPVAIGKNGRRNYIDIIRCRRNEKRSTPCGKYGWCQSILQYSPWTNAFVDLVVSPRQFTNFRSVSLGRGFVSISAMLSDVGVYRKMTSPDLVCSLMKWYQISMCFVRRWFLSVVLFAMEPLLSTQMMIGLLTGNPTSSKYLDIHKA